MKQKLYLRAKDGVAAVEFALIAPLLILLVVGTLDFGFYILEQMRLQNTAYAVAEYVVRTQDSDGASTVADTVYSGENTLSVTSDFECECADGVVAACPVSCDADDYQRRFISVDVSATHETLFVYPGLTDALDLSSTARLRVD